MAGKHPYVQAPGHLRQVVEQLRKSFPSVVSAETLKKLGFAPKNESYVVNTLRFLGLIDSECNKTDLAGTLFSLHDNVKFQEALGDAVKNSYDDLFKLHGEETWNLDANGVITFFRRTDQSSAIVGGRQASTFLTLSSLAGHSHLSNTNTSSKGAKKTSAKKSHAKTKPVRSIEIEATPIAPQGGMTQAVGLTVRIEVNLPASGDQASYDRIFKSIRENLLNG